MLSELYERILEESDARYRAEWIEHPDLPDTVFLRQGTAIQKHEAEPKQRSAGLVSYRALIDYVLDEKICPDPEVYVNFDKIEGFHDRSTRRTRFSCRLEASKRLRALCDMERQEMRMFTPSDLVRFLRFTLPGCKAEGLIASISQVDFTRRSSGASHASHGRESLGQSVEAEVQQRDTIPDTYVFNVPVWMTTGFDHIELAVVAGIYLDPAQEKIGIKTLPDQTVHAVWDALTIATQIVRDELLTSRVVPVFAGGPDPARVVTDISASATL